MNTEQLQTFHEEWKRQPVTTQLARILDKQVVDITDLMAQSSMAIDTVSDQRIRLLSVQLKTIRTIKTLIYDTNAFVENIQKLGS